MQPLLSIAINPCRTPSLDSSYITRRVSTTLRKYDIITIPLPGDALHRDHDHNRNPELRLRIPLLPPTYSTSISRRAFCASPSLSLILLFKRLRRR